ncbi:MAG: flagellar hook-associated protein FlgK [Chloroflexi bacterium]|nr:flagellar hook-associated protein FlgK [Chloroflexota bacterium]
MTWAFFGLDIGARALQAQQTAINTTDHNIANANTPGFSRQIVQLETTPPFTVPGLSSVAGVGQLGTGVAAAAIGRARDGFLDLQYRGEASKLQQSQVTEDTLGRVEGALQEPSDTGIGAELSRFFQAWRDLASNPTDSAARTVVLQQAATLTDRLHQAAQQLQAIGQDLNDQVASAVTDVNDLAQRIATLNLQIVQVESSGQQANDLRDQRDLMLDRLAALTPITTAEQPDGVVNVWIGGHALVSIGNVDGLTTTPTGPGGAWEVRFSSDNALISPTAGKLRGLLDARDQLVPAYQSQLDGLAANLASTVNALHTTGYGLDGLTGRAFFSGNTAATIVVDPTVAGDPKKVGVAGATGRVGDNSVAAAIAALESDAQPTAESLYQALVTGLGSASSSAQHATENHAILLQSITARRQAVSGVSLDEETVNLLRYQRAYEAAARVITAVDQLLNKLINETGVVGR